MKRQLRASTEENHRKVAQRKTKRIEKLVEKKNKSKTHKRKESNSDYQIPNQKGIQKQIEVHGCKQIKIGQEGMQKWEFNEMAKILFKDKFSLKDRQFLDEKMRMVPEVSLKDILSQNKETIFKQFNQDQKVQEIQRYIETIAVYHKYQPIIVINHNNNNYALCYIQNIIDIYKIPQDYSFILTRRSELLRQLYDQQKQFNQLHKKQESLSQISRQTTLLLYLYLENRIHLLQQITKIKLQLEKISEPLNDQQVKGKSEIENPYDQLVKFKVRKNYLRAFENDKIDQLNYFIEIQRKILQKTNHYQKIKTQNQFKSFLKKRKPKIGKADKFVLQTACTICLSHTIQKSNPFLNCKQCHFRFHKLCNQTDKNCDRCIYKRLTKQIKQAVPECFICQRQGLMIKRLSTNKFVHIFCLISHNLWKVEQGQIVFKANQKIQHQKKSECFHCKKMTDEYFQVRCSNCSKPTHMMCAFLHGCNIVTKQQGQHIMFQVNCCNVDKKKLERERKFKLNYQKFVFRNNGIGCNLSQISDS